MKMENQVVYIDILFITNVIINYLLLLATMHLTAADSKLWRLGIGAVIGGIYAVCMFFPTFSFAFSIIGKLAASFVIVGASFTHSSIRAFIRRLGAFYALSFAFGGGVMALYYLTSLPISGFLVSNGIAYFNISLPFLLISTLFCYIFISAIFSLFSSKSKDKERFYETVVTVDDKSIAFKALLDTGNSLKDPISGRPAIIAEIDAVCHLMPDKVVKFFKSGGAETHNLPGMWARRIRMLPFSSVGEEGGLIPAFSADTVLICRKGEREMYKNVMVAVYCTQLSCDGSYKGLLHSNMGK